MSHFSLNLSDVFVLDFGFDSIKETIANFETYTFF